MTPDHQCAAPGCALELPAHLLACRAHWRQLPPWLQAAITKAWHRRRRHPENADLAAAHIAVVQDAVALWAGAMMQVAP